MHTDLQEHHVSEKPSTALPDKTRTTVEDFNRRGMEPRTSLSDKTRFEAEAFNSQGIEHAQRGEFDQAIQNYDQAIRLDSSNFDPLYNRGLAKFMNGQFLAAVPDFEQATSLHPADPYKVIWLYLAQSRAGQNGDEDLARNASRFDPNRWPGPLLSLYQGKTGFQAAIDAVSTAPPGKRHEALCEAHFYAGEHFMIQKKEEEAVRMFRIAMKIGNPSFVEDDGAKAELKRMGKVSTGHSNN